MLWIWGAGCNFPPKQKIVESLSSLIFVTKLHPESCNIF